MNKYRHPKSSLLLIETMINILFFAVLVTICLQLFFKAHTFSKNASGIHRAVTTCASIAEVYQSNLDGKEIVMTVYPDALALNTTILIYFDENYLPCNEAQSSYRVVLEHDNPQDARITFYTKNDDEIVYSLAVSSYAPRTLNALKGADYNEEK